MRLRLIKMWKSMWKICGMFYRFLLGKSRVWKVWWKEWKINRGFWGGLGIFNGGFRVIYTIVSRKNKGMFLEN
nr:MAG TPA: hypothetical protein [Caudoviricetes sp.]